MGIYTPTVGLMTIPYHMETMLQFHHVKVPQRHSPTMRRHARWPLPEVSRPKQWRRPRPHIFGRDRRTGHFNHGSLVVKSFFKLFGCWASFWVSGDSWDAGDATISKELQRDRHGTEQKQSRKSWDTTMEDLGMFVNAVVVVVVVVVKSRVGDPKAKLEHPKQYLIGLQD